MIDHQLSGIFITDNIERYEFGNIQRFTIIWTSKQICSGQNTLEDPAPWIQLAHERTLDFQVDYLQGKKFKDEPINIKKVLDKTDENTSIVSMLSLIMDLSNRTLSNPNFQKLLSNKNIYFDVIIIEWMFSEVYAGLSNVYNCPYVWFSTVEPHWMILDLIDEAPNPSYNVDVISDSVPPFTFVQRVKELSSQVLGRLLRYYYTSSTENQLYEEYIIPHIKSRGGEVSSLDTLKYNASLVLSNSHVSLGLPIRHPVNLIPIGGYHIDSKVKPLPQVT
ncbi:unnamed protein product [Danaus chrysippus]|uniref:(African queen) hypothetical protein n=1 Tax=Danaus chrysippus TaxID=151541 RepID=A0A8J2QNA4_9NEOP|nr:unnamed protein product [Danaus chrysippus]